MSWSFLPNLITLLRIFLLVPLSIFLLNDDYTTALIIFVIAGFSDALDGFLAKHFSWVSRFGAILDPLADKALLVFTMAILTYNQQLSWVLFLIVMLRDVIIVAGAYYYHYRLGPYEMQPSKLSKFNTFIQLLLVASLLVSLGYRPLAEVYLSILIALTYFTTLSSGIHYGWVWGRKLEKELSKKSEDSSLQAQSAENSSKE